MKNKLSDIDNQLMRWLSRREYSRQELVYKLVSRGHSLVLSQIRVGYFAEQNWQSDERFAINLWLTRRNQNYGTRRIIIELQQKGIDKSIINKVMDDTEVMDLKILRNLKEKNGWLNLTGKEMRFLMRRGFTQNQINKIYDE